MRTCLHTTAAETIVDARRAAVFTTVPRVLESLPALRAEVVASDPPTRVLHAVPTKADDVDAWLTWEMQSVEDGSRTLVRLVHEELDTSAGPLPDVEPLLAFLSALLTTSSMDHGDGNESVAPPPEASLILDASAWRVRVGGESVRLRDTKGLRYLAELIEHPGAERHVLDLVAVTEGAASEPGLDRRRLGDAGAMLDAAAKAAYKRRLADLRDDVAEAEAFNDIERAARAKAEIDALVQELTRAVGLNGRDRRAASASERARINVTRAIRTAIERIRAELPVLGDHLDRCVRTGCFCSYEPDSTVRVSAGSQVRS